MKLLTLDYKYGHVELVDVQPPAVTVDSLLIRNANSSVSIGTEKLMIDMARKSILGKALARPDLVRQVIAKARNEGLLETYRAVMSRLDMRIPLGYSCAGFVIDLGANIRSFRVGDAVACFGSGYASHSEIVAVPQNLCVKVPEGMSLEAAAMVGQGAIALHSVRLSDPSIGDRIVVIGLGFLGQLAVQMLSTAGAHVFGIDLENERNAMAMAMGAEITSTPTDSLETQVMEWTSGRGADAVIIFASTPSNAPLNHACSIAAKGARIVVPGMVGLTLPRRLFYEKELRLVVPRSAGPGIYDPAYETKGVDLPIEYVRWTSGRNMSEFLSLVQIGKVKVEPLISHRFTIDNSLEAYETVYDNSKPHMGVILEYAQSDLSTNTVPPIIGQTSKLVAERKSIEGKPAIGLIGAGLHARTTLLPALKSMNSVVLHTVASANGLSAKSVADKYSFLNHVSNYKDILNNPEIDCVIIATRHDLHAQLAIEALSAGKNVFVEKPLALNEVELLRIIEAYRNTSGNLIVGFNRRYSPMAVGARKAMTQRSGPLLMHCTINAGQVPRESWVLDPVQGGGRIVGEVCHFVDLITYLSGSSCLRVYASNFAGMTVGNTGESVNILLELVDGSTASISYVTVGDRSFPRERIECFWDGHACLIDNFRSLVIYENGKIKRKKKWNVDRGHREELSKFLGTLSQGRSPSDFQEAVEATRVTFAILESMQHREPIALKSFVKSG